MPDTPGPVPPELALSSWLGVCCGTDPKPLNSCPVWRAGRESETLGRELVLSELLHGFVVDSSGGVTVFAALRNQKVACAAKSFLQRLPL